MLHPFLVLEFYMLPLTAGIITFRASFRPYYPIDMVHCGLTTGGMVVSAIAFLLFAALPIEFSNHQRT
jgi:uncharacterized phage infection (PIP) family protein YhgE